MADICFTPESAGLGYCEDKKGHRSSKLCKRGCDVVILVGGNGVGSELCNILVETLVILVSFQVVTVDQALNSLLQVRRLDRELELIKKFADK